MEQDFLSEEIYKPERPTFLKVLCILTFIYSGWAIISGTYTYLNANKISTDAAIKMRMTQDDSLRKKNNTGSTNFTTKMMKAAMIVNTPDNIHKKAIGDIIASILCLSGAIIMWKLKKKGYYLYIIGTAIGIGLPFYLYGNNLISVFASAFSGFFGILFLIFYAMNLKSMK